MSASDKINKFVKKIRYKDPILGRTSYRLLNLVTGEEIESFGRYLRDKIKEEYPPKNSVEAWADDLVNFHNYLIAATYILQGLSFDKSASTLSEVVFAYPLFLVQGDLSLNKISKEIAKLLKAKPVSRETAKRRISTLRSYIKSSVIEHENEKAIKKLGIIDVDVAPGILFEEINKRREISNNEKQILIQRSFIGGLVRGGPKYINSSLFNIPRTTSNNVVGKGSWVSKAFPPKYLFKLINEANTYRDRAFWSLLAGTGIRTSEALQLLISDIDAINETVKILPYEARISTYGALEDEYIEELAFKGRNTEEAYFLEPFKTIFFDSLTKYFEERPLCNHDFLFVVLSNNSRGRPWYLGDARSHNRTFKAVQKKIGMESLYTLHSLRHFYGTWMHNFVKHDAGFGLDLSTVKLMMGHASVTTTERYAIKDRELVKRHLESINKHIKDKEFNLEQLQKDSILNINSDVQFYLTSS